MSNFLLFLTMYQLHSYDYYPFGSPMPERSYSSPSYRYGFQGQEKDDEVKGEGNSVNYKYRMHDPRLGRFFAVDPLASKYPYYSQYAFSGNRVIDAVELEGLEPQFVVDTWDYTTELVKETAETVEELATEVKDEWKKAVPTIKVEAKMTIGARAAAEVKNLVGFDANAGSLDVVKVEAEAQNGGKEEKFEFDYMTKDEDVFTQGFEGSLFATAGYEYENDLSNVQNRAAGKEASAGTSKVNLSGGYSGVGVGGEVKYDNNTGKVVSEEANVNAGFKLGIIIIFDVNIKIGGTTELIE